MTTCQPLDASAERSAPRNADSASRGPVQRTATRGSAQTSVRSVTLTTSADSTVDTVSYPRTKPLARSRIVRRNSLDSTTSVVTPSKVCEKASTSCVSTATNAPWTCTTACARASRCAAFSPVTPRSSTAARPVVMTLMPRKQGVPASAVRENITASTIPTGRQSQAQPRCGAKLRRFVRSHPQSHEATGETPTPRPACAALGHPVVLLALTQQIPDCWVHQGCSIGLEEHRSER